MTYMNLHALEKLHQVAHSVTDTNSVLIVLNKFTHNA